MAGGLNKEFLANPATFLGKYIYSVKDQDLATGAVQLGFTSLGGNRLQLAKFASTSKHAHPISAYFLLAVADQVNPGSIDTSGADYFFTSTMQGCQFIAYGASRTSLSVEHNNYLSDTSNYATRYTASGAAGQTVNTRVYNGGLYTVTSDQRDIGNVVGKRDSNGWTLWLSHDAAART